MTMVNQNRVADAFARKTGATSLEDNDVNININAETETGAAEVPEVVESVVLETEDVVTPIPDLDTSDTPEAGELEMQQTGGELDEAVTEVEELDDTVEALECIYMEMANISAENLEITPALMQMTHVAVANAVRRFGLSTDDCGVASVEDASVGSIASSMEGVGDTIKSGVKQIAKMLDGVISFFVDFLKSIFTQVGRSKKRLADVKAARGKVSKTDVEVSIPAALDGHIDAAFYNNTIAFMTKLIGLKYTKLEEMLEADRSVTELEKTILKDISMSLVPFLRKPILPGMTFEFDNKTMIRLIREDKNSVSKKITMSDVDSMLTTAGNLIEEAERYNAIKPQREQAIKKLKAKIESSRGNDDDKSRFTGARELSRFWAALVRTETQLVSGLLTCADALIFTAQKGVAGADKKNEVTKA